VLAPLSAPELDAPELWPLPELPLCAPCVAFVASPQLKATAASRPAVAKDRVRARREGSGWTRLTPKIRIIGGDLRRFDIVNECALEWRGPDLSGCKQAVVERGIHPCPPSSCQHHCHEYDIKASCFEAHRPCPVADAGSQAALPYAVADGRASNGGAEAERRQARQVDRSRQAR
jgi:hypothetical protein